MLIIPLFRAKVLGLDNNYIIGFYQQYIEGFENNIYHEINNTLIDPTTLAIHFPDMLDSQGNKIFASLSKDGKGGDIIEWTIFPSDTQQQRIKGTPYYSGHSVFKITNRMEMMWHSLAPHRKSKIIGIQE